MPSWSQHGQTDGWVEWMEPNGKVNTILFDSLTPTLLPNHLLPLFPFHTSFWCPPWPASGPPSFNQTVPKTFSPITKSWRLPHILYPQMECLSPATTEGSVAHWGVQRRAKSVSSVVASLGLPRPPEAGQTSSSSSGGFPGRSSAKLN